MYLVLLTLKARIGGTNSPYHFHVSRPIPPS